MATIQPTIHLSGLARRLVMDGFLEEAEAFKAYDAAQKKRMQFVSYLVENKILKSRNIAWAGAQEFGVPRLIWMSWTWKPRRPTWLARSSSASTTPCRFSNAATGSISPFRPDQPRRH